jgi:hypothetical protein
MFDFCVDKLEFSGDEKYVRRAIRKEEGLMRDRGLGKKENLGEPTPSHRGSRGNTLGCPPEQSLDFQVAHKGSTSRLEIISVRVSEKARSGKFRHHIRTK